MNLFSDILKRLKHELRVSKDKEVAELLGMSVTAFSERKKRNAFPDRELNELRKSRPDLKLDMDYIITGHRASDYEGNIAQAAKKPIASEVERIAGIYAMLSKPSQDALMDVAKRLRELELLLKQGDGQ